MFIVNVEGAIYRMGKWLIIKRSDQEEHAAGELSLVGGKVEQEGNTANILEKTVIREIMEEVGVKVSTDVIYVHSTSFIATGGETVINTVFLCNYESGEAFPKSPDEVAAVEWLATEDVCPHPDAPAYLIDSIQLASEKLTKI